MFLPARTIECDSVNAQRQVRSDRFAANPAQLFVGGSMDKMSNVSNR
jgi:hypothetical protein